MRKVIVKVKPTKKIIQMYEPFLKYFTKISLIELLQVDFNKNIEILIAEVQLVKGSSVNNIRLPKFVELFDILEHKEDSIVCLAKINYPKYVKFGLMNVDGFWDKPSVTTQEEITRSFISTEDNLKKFIEAMKKIGEVKSITFKKPQYHKSNTLSCLTRKQMEILQIAKKEGYFQEPRKINGTDLAKKLGCTKVTINEHLRRIENKIMNQLID